MFHLSRFCVLLVGSLSVFGLQGQEKPSGITPELPSDVRMRLGTDRFRVRGLQLSAMSPDGKSIAVFSSSTQIDVIDTETGRKIRSFETGEMIHESNLFFTPDGKRLISAGSKGIHVWDAADGKKTISFFADKRLDGMFSLSTDGVAISVVLRQTNKSVRVVRVVDGSELGSIEPIHDSPVYSAVSREGKYVATWGNHFDAGQVNPANAAIPRSVHVWDVKSSKLIASLDTESTPVSAASFSPDGTIIATTGMGMMQLWNLATGKLIWKFPVKYGANESASIMFSPDGKSVSIAAGRGFVETWNLETGKSLGQSQILIDSLPRISYRSDGKLIAWSIYGSRLIIWDALTGKLLTPSGGQSSPSKQMQFTADGKQLISLIYDGRMIRWDVETGRELQSERSMTVSNQALPSPIEFTPNGKYFVGESSKGTGVSLMNAKSNEECFSLQGSNGPIEKSGLFAFSADSRRMIAVNHQNPQKTPLSIPVWDIETGKEIALLKIQNSNIFSAALSTDGEILTTYSFEIKKAGEIFFETSSLNVSNGKLLSTISIPKTKFYSIGYINHRLFLMMDRNGHALICDAFSGKQLQTLENIPSSNDCHFGMSLDHRLVGISMSTYTLQQPGSNKYKVSNKINIWETASGSLKQHLQVPSLVYSFAFSSDNKMLAVSLEDTTILLYDLDKSHSSKQAKEVGIEANWITIDAKSAPDAWAAMHAFISKPEESVPYLKSHISASPKTDKDRIAKRIAELDSPRYAVRETAMKELEQFATDANEQIKAELAKKTISVEMRERLEKLTDSSFKPPLETNVLRPLRAIEILERINNPAAKDHLKTLAAGGDSTVTRAAREALMRLNGK